MKNLELNSDFEMVFRGEYLHILHPPNYEITSEGMKKLWTTLVEACQTHQCTKVLAEGKVYLRKMNAGEAYSSGTTAATIPRLRLACLFYDYVPDDLTAFFKMVSSNRGVAVEFFTKKEDALKWLDVTTTVD